MKLSIIIPAHNEEATIAAVLKQVADVSLGEWEKEIVVVDDGSTDQTALVIESWQNNPSCLNYGRALNKMLVLHHKVNLGKGAAIQTALKNVTGDYVLIQDADLEYHPGDIPIILSKIPLEGSLQGESPGRDPSRAVFGDRGIKSYPERGFHYVIVAKILTWCFNILFGVWLHDLYTGYKLIPADIFKSLGIESSGFEFEAEVAAKLILHGVKIIEVPIQNYRPRSKQQGKHIRAKDAIIGLGAIVKYRVL